MRREGYKCRVKCSTPAVSPSFVWADKLDRGEQAHETEVIKNMTGKSAYVLSSVMEEEKGIFYARNGLSEKYVLTDFFSQGVLKGELEHLTERRSAAYFWQLVRGMQDMHDQNLVHANINLENAFVHCEGLICYAALVELQYACQIDQKLRPHAPTNDEKYFRPPEGARGDAKCLPSYDVWSMGVLLHYLFFRKYPDSKEPQITAAVEAYKKENPDTKPEVVQKVQEILEKALAPDPAQRIAGTELLDEAKQLLELADAEQAAKIVDKVPSEYGARKPAPKCLNVWPDGPHCGTGKLQKTAVLNQLAALNPLSFMEDYSWTGGGCYLMKSTGCVRCACDDEKTQTHFEFYLKSC
mmetsp:Transcript_1054/g.2853  ORF Transcript_1054/g.2853 Transcript_1054/m.2853 type:complete len:354 (+) Transcript_1054:170-1231(+)